MGKQWKQWQILFLRGSKITADGDCSHEIKICLLLGKRSMIHLDSILKSRDITLPTEVCLVKATVFPVAMYGCREGNGNPLQYSSLELAWTEEPGRLQSMGSQRVGHNWVTSLSLFTFMHWRQNGNPLQHSCLEHPMDGGAWWAAVCGVAQNLTWLKQLSSSSSSMYGWIGL